MKILGIVLFIYFLLAGVILGFDLLQGFGISKSLRLAFNPLYVMEAPELAILYLLLIILFARAVFAFVQGRMK